ncbi:MAG: hypothetical protein KKD08_05985 [Alphaproteobacteria bacterium]|nr:hypothetical protein [Alphaproteobacteria bacterium]
MTIVSETRSAWQIEQGKKCGCRGLDDYCPCQNTDRTTAAPPTNTAGLVAEIDAEMQGRRRGYADVRGELLFRCRDSLVTAASAQARIAELEARILDLEAERDKIAGESIWWKAVIGDGGYTPSGEVPSIKHLHPAMVKPIYEANKGTAVADVIAGLIFSRAITENREQFLVTNANERAQAAEDRADRLADGITAAMLILTPEPGNKPLTDREKTARQCLAALQQEPTTSSATLKGADHD